MWNAATTEQNVFVGMKRSIEAKNWHRGVLKESFQPECLDEETFRSKTPVSSQSHFLFFKEEEVLNDIVEPKLSRKKNVQCL